MDEQRMSIREVRAALGRRVDAAFYLGEPTVITKNDEPRAVLVPYADYAGRASCGVAHPDVE